MWSTASKPPKSDGLECFTHNTRVFDGKQMLSIFGFPRPNIEKGALWNSGEWVYRNDATIFHLTDQFWSTASWKIWELSIKESLMTVGKMIVFSCMFWGAAHQPASHVNIFDSLIVGPVIV